MIAWHGLSDDTSEVLELYYSENNIEVNSVISGNAEGIFVLVHYKLLLNSEWETVSVEIKADLGREETLYLLKKENGIWFKNGKVATELSKCVDIDISLTPFTNSLPVNRLKLKIGEENLIEVVYFDILNREVNPVQQRYKKLDDTSYRFQTVPSDFEAIITFDNKGLVTNYPGLFRRKEI